MCAHGDTVECFVTILASHSHEGRDIVKAKPIDRCIADIVVALEGSGIRMYGSCCGHGDSPGDIPLADGRRLRVLRDEGIPVHEEARA